LTDLAEQGFVAVERSQLEELGQIGDLLAELVEALDRAFVARALLQELLRALLVVPEARRQAVVVQALDAVTQPVDVKGTSPAPRGAGSGPRAGRAVR
jgi:hypothetical protein